MKLHIALIAWFTSSSAHANPCARVAIVFGDANHATIDAVQSHLYSTGYFTAIDTFEAYGAPPQLSDFDAYDSVFAYTLAGLRTTDEVDSTVAAWDWGNFLADYADRGGGVVLAANGASHFYGFTGRISVDFPIRQRTGTVLDLGDGSMTRRDPHHPIFLAAGEGRCVNSSCSTYGYAEFDTEADALATWENGQPAIGTLPGIVSFNVVPWSDEDRHRGWDATSDMPTLFANALTWTAASCAPDDDNDGLSLGSEQALGTDPLLPDTDGDGLDDIDEAQVTLTDPTLWDTDGDGLSDGDELDQYDTDPLNADMDGDGLSDGDELLDTLTDPLLPDTDEDGLSDGEEVHTTGTDPLNDDTDGDSVLDGADNCPHDANADQVDSDDDGVGDVCQLPDDGDSEVDTEVDTNADTEVDTDDDRDTDVDSDTERSVGLRCDASGGAPPGLALALLALLFRVRRRR